MNNWLMPVVAVVMAGCLHVPASALIEIVDTDIRTQGSLQIGDEYAIEADDVEEEYFLSVGHIVGTSVWMSITTELGYAQLRSSASAHVRTPLRPDASRQESLLWVINSDHHSYPLVPTTSDIPVSAVAENRGWIQFRLTDWVDVTLSPISVRVPEIRRSSDGTVAIPRGERSALLAPGVYEFSDEWVDRWSGFTEDGPGYCPPGFDCWMGTFEGLELFAAPANAIPEPASLAIWSLLAVLGGILANWRSGNAP